MMMDTEIDVLIKYVQLKGFLDAHPEDKLVESAVLELTNRLERLRKRNGV